MGSCSLRSATLGVTVVGDSEENSKIPSDIPYTLTSLSECVIRKEIIAHRDITRKVSVIQAALVQKFSIHTLTCALKTKRFHRSCFLSAVCST